MTYLVFLWAKAGLVIGPCKFVHALTFTFTTTRNLLSLPSRSPITPQSGDIPLLQSPNQLLSPKRARDVAVCDNATRKSTGGIPGNDEKAYIPLDGGSRTNARSLFNCEKYSDFKIKCQDEIVPIHKPIVYPQSDFFDAVTRFGQVSAHGPERTGPC
ncbi:hypothetical protein K458DRAFT_422473 [Lentithecium fluviatile CBS 122367]|uniref:BTB domain-containing protein n=1 Tax=Lentithecium fluviatile CBS 122367 TaxID=1168545 RepID=A0A6G1IMP7_9PLEO|nr:hypothetical protein K458DRAFT_422473 [Lentithecium fluviatile CBS 122367]